MNKIIHNPYCDPSFLRYIDIDSIKVIFEIGMYDGKYTKPILDVYYNCEQLHGFECNPAQFDACEKNIHGLDKVKFNKVALGKEDGIVTFRPCVRGRVAASSFYQISDQFENQSEVSIECKTVNSYCKHENINAIDLMCIDVEGAEMSVFLGADDLLRNTRYIIVEVQNIYRYLQKIPLRNDVSQFLKDFGFEERFYHGSHIDDGDPFGDILYGNKNYD